MKLSLFSAKEILKNMYLELVNLALQGKELPTAEEKAAEFMEKLDSDLRS